jgi:CRISPR-associated protein Cas5d
MTAQNQILEVWGDFGCFTRPEMKVERFSYPIITPSAARGILDAIYWKSKFRWQVTKVETFTPLNYIALRRNEVKDRAPTEKVICSWIIEQGRSKKVEVREPKPIFIDESRTQRQTMALKNVRYRIHAKIHPYKGYEDEIQDMEAQFRRRAARGQCVHQPYLGCREFPAYFQLIDQTEVLQAPSSFSQNIGWMLYDVFNLSRPGKNSDKPFISLFRANIEKGVLSIPNYSSTDVKKPEESADNA